MDTFHESFGLHVDAPAAPVQPIKVNELTIGAVQLGIELDPLIHISVPNGDSTVPPDPGVIAHPLTRHALHTDDVVSQYCPSGHRHDAPPMTFIPPAHEDSEHEPVYPSPRALQVCVTLPPLTFWVHPCVPTIFGVHICTAHVRYVADAALVSHIVPAPHPATSSITVSQHVFCGPLFAPSHPPIPFGTIQSKVCDPTAVIFCPPKSDDPDPV